MASGNRVELIFAGDSTSLEKSFAKVGSASTEMATDVGKASKRMADDAGGASKNIGDSIGDQESKFQGLASTINGTGDVMEGFKTGNVATMAMGFADLADGISKSVMPALMFMKTTLLTGLAPALTMISAHPLIAGLIGGAAIIAGLILLEKKFGLVSGAVGALGDVFADIWPGIKAVINGIIGGLEFIANAAIRAVTAPIGVLNMIPGVKSIIPDVPQVRLPRLHTGGVFPGVAGREGLAVLQAGETVSGPGQGGGGGITINVGGSVITERDLGRIVADALRNNRLIGVT